MDFALYKAIENAIGIGSYSGNIIHYTNTNTLNSILGSKELWFGNILDMNDTSECRHFLDGIEQAFNTSFGKLKTTEYWHIISKAKERILTETFASSWCEYVESEPDGSLPMWQEYGANGQGIGIIVDTSGFSPETLNERKIQFFINYSKMDYISASKSNNYALDLIERISSNIEFENEEMRLIANAILLLTRAPTIKHNGFSHEKEIRFLSLDPIPDLSPGRGEATIFETKIRGEHRRFARVPLKKYESYDIDLSIDRVFKSIVIGPGEKQLEREEEVRSILDKNNLNSIKVIRSNIPYRKI